MEKTYFVLAFEWDSDRREYVCVCKGETEDLGDAETLFRSIGTDADCVKVELWENGEDEDILLTYKEAEEEA